MPGLPGHRHRPHRNPLRSGGIDMGLSLSLFHLRPSQMGAKPLQGDVEAAQRVEGGSKVTVRTWVRNNMC